MSDINLLFFILVTFLILTSYYEKPAWLKAGLLGLFTGLTIATKWNGFFLLIPVMGVVTCMSYREKTLVSFRTVGKALIIICIAGGVYFLSYFQYFLLGADLNNWWDLQKAMWSYHTLLKEGHNYQAAWWSWPLMLRPTWYFVEYGEEMRRNIYAMGNPIIWWMGIAGLVFVLIKWFQEKSFSLFIILAGYIVFWFPWIISPRITFLHHYLPSLPFLYLALGLFMAWLFGLGKIGRGSAIIYFLAVIFAFYFFYPLVVGEPLSEEALNLRFWLSSWK